MSSGSELETPYMNKKLIFAILGLLFVTVLAIWFFNQRRTDLKEELPIALDIESSSLLDELTYTDEIVDFYKKRDYLEIWLFNGSPSKSGEELIEAIADSKYDGLQPEDYNWRQISNLSTNPDKKKRKFKNLSTDEQVRLEILLSDGFFKLLHDLESGKVDPAKLDPQWKFEAKSTNTNYSKLLDEIVNGNSVPETLAKVYPNSKIYRRSKEAIQKLYAILDRDTLTWEFEAVKGAIEVGEHHPAIPNLRKRISFWDFLKPYEPTNTTQFDSVMYEGLRRYQKANGMNPDGVIGELVAESLNKSPQDFIDIASINMERLRWMPELDWEEEMVLVNIANYQLDYIEQSDTVFSAKVIVGKEYSESPTFVAPMTYIAFSPYWNIPFSITQDEIIPAMKKDESYLSKKNMEVTTASGEPVNHKTINWSKMKGNEFPYFIRQKPGGDNSLGLVKFMFPNEYNIYIHDTPARGLFSKESRALSHGCIRIQNPDQFAKILLDDDSWSDEKIRIAMNQDTEEVVLLNRKIPVVLVYLTFWADENGDSHFRSDIYDRDRALLDALKTHKSSRGKS